MSFWKKLFGKGEGEAERIEEQHFEDPFVDLVLDKLQPGWLVDHDMRTWEVTAHHYSDLGDGFRTEEWELRNEGELQYLNREEDDGVYWTLTRKAPIGMIDERLRSYIQQNGDPPETQFVNDERYAMVNYGGAKFFRNCQEPPQPFIYWNYEDESGKKVLTIEQWGDIEFEAYVGGYVEEYQFTNILPRKHR